MAALNFPSSPSVDDTYTSGGHTWVWNGTVWLSAPGLPIEDIIDNLIADYFTANPVFQWDTGTKLIAAQTSAPTGWTKDTTHDDKALRLVNGTVSTGGSSPFTTVFASRTPTGTISSDSLSTAQLASHTHTIPRNSGPTSSPSNLGPGGPTSNPAVNSGSAGSGSTHSHTFTGGALSFAVNYVDVIIITKA